MTATSIHTTSVQIPAGNVLLQGDLTVPEHAHGIVLFAHGSGSSRLSPRNRYVAELLQHDGLATLLFDLLTEAEERVDAFDASLRFNIPLLTARLVHATDWVKVQDEVSALPIGYFGASTGAAAALQAAAKRPKVVHAVVSRGGRPDLAIHEAPHVQAATLLIVGERDREVLALNRQALEAMTCQKNLVIVPGATHLLEEPGTLDIAARFARDWLSTHLME
ncbi:MAG TPA: dienelactone hydrolase family protein [Longimicrobiales bacterium]